MRSLAQRLAHRCRARRRRASRSPSAEPLVDQQLAGRSRVRSRARRSGCSRAGRDDRVEKAPLHSTRSTKIWILPPQARPTSQAWSLVTPKSRRRGLPSRITSSASVDDRALDAAARYRADHGAGIVDRELGADRPRRGAPGADHRRQRHARARLAPAPRLFEDFGCIAHAALSWFVRHAAAAVPRRRCRRAQHLDQGFEAFEIVHRPELVDMRHHRLHPERSWLETLVAQQRVQPNQPAAGAVQPVHLVREAGAGVAVEPVGDQQHDRALARAAAATTAG